MNGRVVGAWMVAGALLLSACKSRQVEVRTSPSTAQSQASVQVSNKLSQAVNVYVVMSGNETFLRQVAANTSPTLPVQGIPAGSSVTLKAVTVDGARTYSRQVVLTGTVAFPLP